MKALRGFLSRAALGIAAFTLYSGTSFSWLGVSDLSLITPADLVKNIIGCGVQPGDIRYIGDKSAAGVFSGGGGWYGIGIDNGIVLCTGKAGNVIGPNKDNATSDTFTPNRTDSDLEVLASQISGVPTQTFDAAVLEFEFTPSSTFVTFDYVFASEEYNEFANTQFVDVFAFILNGINVALVPNTNLPVSADSINGGNPYNAPADPTAIPPRLGPQHPSLFRNNALDTRIYYWETEMDGFTRVLTVNAPVMANRRNIMKIAIADSANASVNSAVFIRAGSFSSAKCPVVVAGSATQLESGALAVSPNPYRPGSGGPNDAGAMSFRNIPGGASVRIYTPGGVLINELVDSDSDRTVTWNARNSSGKPVASGVYIYVVNAADRTISRGKVVIIR